MITAAKPKFTEGTHLSASQLRTFSQCSLQWLLSRHHKPQCVGSSLRFGGCCHCAIQAFYQGRLEGREVSPKEMLTAFEASWAEEAANEPDVPVQFGKGETVESLRETAARMFDAFVNEAKPGTIIAVEEPFECHLGDGLPPLVGFIDLVEIRKDPRGVERLCVVDFKTAGRRPAEDEVDMDQLVLYGLGLARTGFLKQFKMPLELRYDFLLKTKKTELLSIPVRPTKRDAERLLAKARVVWSAMKQQIAWPNPSWMCAGCGHRELCGKWPNIPAAA